MRTAATLALLCLATLALGACGENTQAERQDTAGGEILARSVSDEMLPYDTLRSQPPLAPKPKATGKSDETSTEDASGEDDAESAEADTIAEAVAAGEEQVRQTGE